MKIQLYGRLADAIGRQIEVEAAEGLSLAELRKQLVADHPQAAEPLGRSRAVIGRTLVADDYVLRDGDEVELLPPVSGG